MWVYASDRTKHFPLRIRNPGLFPNAVSAATPIQISLVSQPPAYICCTQRRPCLGSMRHSDQDGNAKARRVVVDDRRPVTEAGPESPAAVSELSSPDRPLLPRRPSGVLAQTAPDHARRVSKEDMANVDGRPSGLRGEGGHARQVVDGQEPRLSA